MRLVSGAQWGMIFFASGVKYIGHKVTYSGLS